MPAEAAVEVRSRISSANKGYISATVLLLLLLSVAGALGRQLTVELRALTRNLRAEQASANIGTAVPLAGYQPDGRPSLGSLTFGNARHVLIFVLHPNQGAAGAKLYLDAANWLRDRGVRLLAVCGGGACPNQAAGGDAENALPTVAYASYVGMKAAADADASGMILMASVDYWRVEKRLRPPASTAELKQIVGRALAETATAATPPAGKAFRR
jgi:hypothetical protein